MLKKNNKCTIEVHPAFASRVRKAVIKEKDGDIVHKYETTENKFRLCVSYDKKKRLMTFTLKQRFNI